jgi:hypothetical protein
VEHFLSKVPTYLLFIVEYKTLPKKAINLFELFNNRVKDNETTWRVLGLCYS